MSTPLAPVSYSSPSLTPARSGRTRFEGGLQTSPAFASLEAGLSYSQAIDWLKQPNSLATIERIGIEYDPDDWRALAQARFYLHNGQSWSVTLPHDEQAFIQQVQQAGVPFYYNNHHPSKAEAFRHVASHTARDALLPLMVFSLTTLTGLGIYNRAQGWLASQKLGQMLKQAVKTYTPDTAQRLKQALPQLPSDARRLVNQFMQNQQDLLLAEGPPGTGKTHLLDSLAAHAQKAGNTLVLEVGGDMGDVRDLLYRLYSGDADKSRFALKNLQKLVGSPLKQLVLRVDELEDVAEELHPLITKGMGNGQPAHLPRLRVLATCNRLPVTSDAIKNRVNRGRLFLDYPSAAAKADALAHQLNPNAPQTLKPLLKAVLDQHPGYSMRSLQSAVQSVKAANPRQYAASLSEQLNLTPLDDTEMAGVLRHRLLQALPAGTLPVVKSFINRHSLEASEQAVTGMDSHFSLNGQQFSQLVKAAMMEQNQPVPLDPDDLLIYIQHVARTLRTKAPSLLSGLK
jgi:MoxR-like ATPase